MHKLEDIDISIDSREPKATKFITKIIDAGYHPKLELLPTSDFIIYGTSEKDVIIIERKDDSDFLSSVEGKRNEDGSWEIGRIWDQLKRMKESGVENRWVVIEGNPFSSRLSAYRKKGFTRERIWGAMEGIAAWNTHIMRTVDDEDTINWIIHLIKKQKSPKKPFTLRTSAPHEMTLKEKKLYILQGFPGVGAKTSNNILKEYDTLMSFFNNISKSKSVGDKTKKEIGKILN